MSECVVRMEFPLNCLECPMYDWNRQKLCCNAHHELRPIPNGGAPKPDWCPIICQLPEGHGRMVDTDAIKLPKGFFEKVDNVPKFYGWLNSLPTIVPAAAERSET